MSAVPQLCQLLSPVPGVFGTWLPKAEVPFGFGGFLVLGFLAQEELTACVSLQVDLRLRTSASKMVQGCCGWQ